MLIRFTLNPKNEKDKLIIDMLNKEYNPNDSIKNILYKVFTNDHERPLVSPLVTCETVKEYSETTISDQNGQVETVEDNLADEFKDFF
ncbi:MAG: hypothetical protein ACLR02_11235 [Clostridium sp.]